jgi:hypothetical protein
MSLKLESHLFRVLENQIKLYNFLGEFDWNFDMDKGLLSFSKKKKGGLSSLFKKNKETEIIAECPVQLLATHSNSDQSWLWAWANAGSEIPENLLRGIEQVRQEGEKQDITLFTREILPLLATTSGDLLAVICTGYLNHFTYFVGLYPDGKMFTSIETFPQAEGQMRNALLAIQTIQTGIQTFAFPHKDAVHSYLGEPLAVHDDEFIWDLNGEQIQIRFNDQGRIADMQTKISKPQ